MKKFSYTAYLLISGKPYSIEGEYYASFRRYRVYTTEERFEINYKNSVLLRNQIDADLKSEGVSDYTICYVVSDNAAIASEVNSQIKLSVFRKICPEMLKKQTNEIKQVRGDSYLFEIILEEHIEQNDAVFQEWLCESGHPNLFVSRPEIFNPA